MRPITVEDGLNFETGEWVRHWMTSAEAGLPQGEGERWQDPAGMWHLRVRQPANGPVRFVSGPFETVRVVWGEGGIPRAGERVTIPWGVSGWLLRVTGRMRDAIVQAGDAYRGRYGRAADTAYVRRIPQGAEEGVVVAGMMLIQAAWVPGRCVFVCRLEAGDDND